MTTVVITDLEYQRGRAAFDASGFRCVPAPAPEAQLAGVVKSQGARYVVVGVEPYTGPLYEEIPAGGVLARFGVGHDGINKALASRKGILCTNTPEVLNQSVAEYTISLILLCARRVSRMDSDLHNGAWAPFQGKELKDSRLAVIGCGGIGRLVARTASLGFGMSVAGQYRREETRRELEGLGFFALLTTSFEEAVKDADFVTLHIPANTTTRHVINRSRLEALPSKAYLINTSRGSILDEDALWDALVGQRIAGAALDVFENEPYEPIAEGKDLRRLDNVVLSPHIASGTKAAGQRMATAVIRNVRLAEEGRYGEMDLLNPDVIKADGSSGRSRASQ